MQLISPIVGRGVPISPLPMLAGEEVEGSFMCCKEVGVHCTVGSSGFSRSLCFM